MAQDRRDNRGSSDIAKWAREFNTSWIQNGITKEAVVYTENFGKYLEKEKLTTSQIRNVYGELKRIELKGYEEEKTAFLLLKPKMAYALVRQKSDGLRAFKQIFDLCYEQIDSSEKYTNFMQIMEATLAYHKSFGGK